MGLAITEMKQDMVGAQQIRPDLEYILYKDNGVEVYSDNLALISEFPNPRTVILHGVYKETDLKGSLFEGFSAIGSAYSPEGEVRFTQLIYPLYGATIPSRRGGALTIIKMPVIRERKKLRADGTLDYNLLWLSGHFHEDFIRQVPEFDQFDDIQHVVDEQGGRSTVLSFGINDWFEKHADVWMGRNRENGMLELFDCQVPHFLRTGSETLFVLNW